MIPSFWFAVVFMFLQQVAVFPTDANELENSKTIISRHQTCLFWKPLWETIWYSYCEIIHYLLFIYIINKTGKGIVHVLVYVMTHLMRTVSFDFMLLKNWWGLSWSKGINLGKVCRAFFPQRHFLTNFQHHRCTSNQINWNDSQTLFLQREIFAKCFVH